LAYELDDVKLTSGISGANERTGYGFNMLRDPGEGPRLIVQFLYATKNDAEQAHTLIAKAIASAVSVKTPKI